jgi:hypothetical protein
MIKIKNIKISVWTPQSPAVKHGGRLRQRTAASRVVVAWLFLLLNGLVFAKDEVEFRDLPGEVFLRMAQRPFRNNAWGRFAGRIQHRSDGLNTKMEIHLSVLFQEDLMRGQLVLDRHKLYGITQIYYAEGVPGTTLDLPPEESSPTLAELGVRAEDLAFSFLYWEPLRELEMDEVRGRDCRVFRFRHPDTEEEVEAWFSVEYLFPIKAKWFEPGTDQPSRTLEFTDFERDGDLWYVKSFRMEGDGWKTRVKFTDGELHLVEEEPPPPDLFLSRDALLGSGARSPLR